MAGQAIVGLIQNDSVPLLPPPPQWEVLCCGQQVSSDSDHRGIDLSLNGAIDGYTQSAFVQWASTVPVDAYHVRYYERIGYHYVVWQGDFNVGPA